MSRTWKDTKRYKTRLSKLIGWCYSWNLAPGGGQYWKRLLHKAERRAWRNPGHTRGLYSLRSNVNWKLH